MKVCVAVSKATPPFHFYSSSPALPLARVAGKVQGAVEFDDKGDIKDGMIVIDRAVAGRLVEQKNLK
ncbi:MAG TPA: hypothetical protein VEC35_02500 [Noviherbaspirillum sp.]|nr:hypothetical protein [Noviherbaspirillum sp.]